MISEIQSYNSGVSAQNKNRINNKIHFKNNGSWLSVVNSRQVEDVFSRMRLSNNIPSRHVLGLIAKRIDDLSTKFKQNNSGLTRYLIIDEISGIIGKAKFLYTNPKGVQIKGKLSWNDPHPLSAEEVAKAEALYKNVSRKPIPAEDDVAVCWSFDEGLIAAYKNLGEK